MNVRYKVRLDAGERGELEAMVSGGAKFVRIAKRAQILLAAADGETDEQISRLVRVGTSTVYRTKRRCVEDGIDEALHDRERAGGARKLSVKEEALLVATACSAPSSGRARWTMQLLADEMVRLTEHTGVSRETVRRRLAENEIKPWQQKMWCVPKVDADYVARMEDVLDLYASKPDAKQPIVSFDESPVQLIGESREPIPAAPGRPARVDYEYVRNGTANLFVFLDVHRPWRHVKVTDRRVPRATSPSACAISSTCTTRRPSGSGSCSTTSRPTRGRALPVFSAGRSAPHLAPAGVPLRAEARELAEHGGDRDRRSEGPVPRAAHRRSNDSRS
jgi:transposase